VTGSFNASLAQWLLGSSRARAPHVARQGTTLGRAGRVHIREEDDGSIWVGGGLVTCVRGRIEVCQRDYWCFRHEIWGSSPLELLASVSQAVWASVSEAFLFHSADRHRRDPIPADNEEDSLSENLRVRSALRRYR
jgi:hypothetical protein